MNEENEQPQEEVVVEEDQPTNEEPVESNEETQDEDTVTLSKSEYTKLKRQSIAYKAKKDEKVESTTQPRQEGHSIDTLFLIKDLAADEYVTLKEEADDLGVPLERYLTSNSGKSVLSKMRGDKKSKEASTTLTSKSPIYKKFTREDLTSMTSKEIEKILPR